jgi:hypothetical protein
MKNNVAIVESRVNADRVRIQLPDASVDRARINNEAASTKLEKSEKERRLAAIAAKLKTMQDDLAAEQKTEIEAARILRHGECNESTKK